MRARRIELGLSSSQLSELTGMTTLFIEQLEGGRISVTVPLLCRLAEALRMRVQIAFVPE